MSDVFICYSHKDVSFLERAEVHLKAISRKGLVTVFSDREISADQQWRERIRREIESATVAILLVSADFLASDFINDHELPELVKRRSKGQLRVFSVFVGHCSWQRFPEISEYQGFNDPSQPLADLNEASRERIYANLANQVDSEIRSSRAQAGAAAEVEERSKIDYVRLPEVNYGTLSGQQVFSRVSVCIPMLALTLRSSVLFRYSFTECFVTGPAVIFSTDMKLQNSSFGLATGDIENMLCNAVGNTIEGAIAMPQATFEGCHLELLSFVDKDRHIERRLKNQLTRS